VASVTWAVATTVETTAGDRIADEMTAVGLTVAGLTVVGRTVAAGTMIADPTTTRWDSRLRRPGPTKALPTTGAGRGDPEAQAPTGTTVPTTSVEEEADPHLAWEAGTTVPKTTDRRRASTKGRGALGVPHPLRLREARADPRADRLVTGACSRVEWAGLVRSRLRLGAFPLPCRSGLLRANSGAAITRIL